MYVAYTCTACTCLKAALQVLVDAHHRAAVVELAAVVGRRKDSHEATVGEELVSILDDLVFGFGFGFGFVFVFGFGGSGSGSG